MMADFERQLEQFQNQVEKLVPSKKKQEVANMAGAEVYKERLTAVTRSKHYSHKKDPKYGHMADHISASTKNVDGIEDGTATVGWANRYHAMNAMRLNDGTVHIKADHFVDTTREESRKAILDAQAATLGFKSR